MVVDSAPIIYVLEDNSRFVMRYIPLFEAEARGHLRLAISAITIAEVLSGPLGISDEILTARYRRVLCGWEVHPVDSDIAVVAARFRLAYRLKLPDAIQLATVVASEAYALVTHDRDFRRVKNIRVLS